MYMSLCLTFRSCESFSIHNTRRSEIIPISHDRLRTHISEAVKSASKLSENMAFLLDPLKRAQNGRYGQYGRYRRYRRYRRFMKFEDRPFLDP
jgi:hypothetical protein